MELSRSLPGFYSTDLWNVLWKIDATDGLPKRTFYGEARKFLRGLEARGLFISEIRVKGGSVRRYYRLTP